MGKTIADVSKDLANAVSAGRAEIDGFRKANAAKRREREETENAIVPLAEVDARIDAYVDRVGAEWLQTAAVAIIGFAHPKVDGASPIGQFDMATFAAAAAMAPDVVKAQLKRIVRLAIKQLGHKHGLATKDRPAVLARLDEEISVLEVEEEAAIDGLIAAGVAGVAHRPEVLDRRRRLAEFNKLRDVRRAALEESARQNREYYRRHQQDVPAGHAGHPGWNVDEVLAAQERAIRAGGPVQSV